MNKYQKAMCTKKGKKQKLTETESRYATVEGEKGIQYDKTTKKYVVRVLYGMDSTGKQVRRFKTFSTLKEAKEYKEEFKAKKRLKQTPPPLKKITLGQYAEEFLERHKEEVEKTTTEYYEKIYKRMKQYKIFKMEIQTVGKQDILNYIQILRETTNLKPQTINKDLGFLRTLFINAKIDEYTEKNPAELVKNLKVTDKFVAGTYSEEEVRKIFHCLKKYPNRNIRILFYLGLCLGLRRGEIMGLKWESVDFKNEEIRINNTRVALQNMIIEKCPKSKTSERLLSIANFPFLVEELKAYKKWQKENHPQSQYVMINPQTGNPLNPRGLTHALETFRNKCDIRELRVHDLRHTQATIALKNGASLDEVSRALGHSNTRITQEVYNHVTEKVANNGAANAFMRIFDHEEEKNE